MIYRRPIHASRPLLLTAFIAAIALLSAALPVSATYSIVARDPATGELGVAVQSHWFQVGTGVPWIEPGVGAVATQSLTNVSFGPRGLKLMAAGKTAQETMDALIKSDEGRELRQVGIVDASGNVAVWTGARCIKEAGNQTGAQYTVQANLMDKDTVPAAMAAAFEAAEGDLADRMMAALKAGEAEGGDIRGRQSAAMVVVAPESTGESWKDRRIDIRVDDDPAPLEELERLLRLTRAYQAMNAGDDAMGEDDFEAAVAHYTTGTEFAPEIDELPFWQAVTLWGVGREDEALALFREVFARAPDDRWQRLVPRLPHSGLLPDDAEGIARILAVAPKTE